MEALTNITEEKSNQGGLSYADKRRAEKKDALREFVKGQQYIHAINRDLDRPISPEELPEVKFKTETRLKLLSKVLPDLKAVEHSGGQTIDLIARVERAIIAPGNDPTLIRIDPTPIENSKD